MRTAAVVIPLIRALWLWSAVVKEVALYVSTRTSEDRLRITNFLPAA
jgi:hypothetical protein